MGGGVISFWIDADELPQVVDAAHPLPVTATVTGVSQVDIEKIDGVAAVTAKAGVLAIGGPDANAAAPTAAPVLAAGTDGAAVRTISTSTGGAVNMAASGGALITSGGGLVIAGNTANGGASNPSPVTVAGYDGANVRSLALNSAGQVVLPTQNIAGNTSVTNGQRILAFDGNGNTDNRVLGASDGRIITKPYSPPTSDLANTQTIAAAGTTQIFAAPGAGLKLSMTALQISGVAATVATTVTVKNGGTAVWVVDVPAGASHFDIVFQTPLLASLNTAFNVTTDAGGPIKFNAQGFAGQP